MGCVSSTLTYRTKASLERGWLFVFALANIEIMITFVVSCGYDILEATQKQTSTLIGVCFFSQDN